MPRSAVSASHQVRTGDAILERYGLLRRSNFRRRVWLPAVAGDRTREWAPIHPGLHFHDLRHTHKTWLIEDGVPEVVQAKRLGHRMPGVRGVYSHVTQPMIDALLAGLQHRGEHLLPDHKR
jgi:integrase